MWARADFPGLQGMPLSRGKRSMGFRFCRRHCMNSIRSFKGTGNAAFLAACLQNQELRRLPTSRSGWLVQWFVPASRPLRGNDLFRHLLRKCHLTLV